MTKAERSVSKEGPLQPRCHSKARSLSRELLNGLFGLLIHCIYMYIQLLFQLKVSDHNAD